MEVDYTSVIALRHNLAVEGVELARVDADGVFPRAECVHRGLAIGSACDTVAADVVDVALRRMRCDLSCLADGVYMHQESLSRFMIK